MACSRPPSRGGRDSQPRLLLSGEIDTEYRGIDQQLLGVVLADPAARHVRPEPRCRAPVHEATCEAVGRGGCSVQRALVDEQHAAHS
jgi:hypothetical protein